MKKINLGYGDMVGLLLVAISLFGALAITSSAQVTTGTGGTGTAGNAIISTLCSVFDTVRTVIFILAITLFVLGGVLYAGANMMPSSQRGTFQGYGMAMIIGAVIGIAIVIAAPFVLSIVVSTNPNALPTSIVGTTGTGTGTVGSVNGIGVAGTICTSAGSSI